MAEDYPKTIAGENDLISERYPSVNIAGHLVHVFQNFRGSSTWSVWMNTEAADFDGLCIGLGSSRDNAIWHAVEALEAIVDFLQSPPPSHEP